MLTMWACVVLLLISYKFEFLNSDILVIAGSILFAARYINPDIDMKNTIPYKNWGVFRHLLIPYASTVAHRDSSHHPIWGPLTLIPYTFVCFALITWFLIVFCLPVVNSIADYVIMVVASLKCGVLPGGFLKSLINVVIGVVVAIELHILYDLIGKGDRNA